MWNTLFPAIMPLVGVIVGAVITTGTNYMLAVRKEKAEEALVARKEAAEAAKVQIARANELRIVARMVRNELYAVHASASIIIENKHFVPGKVARNYPLDSWDKSKGVLARELSYNDYQAVELATRRVDHFRCSLGLYMNLDDDTIEFIKGIIEDINAGLDALLPYTRDGHNQKGA